MTDSHDPREGARFETWQLADPAVKMKSSRLGKLGILAAMVGGLAGIIVGCNVVLDLTYKPSAAEVLIEQDLYDPMFARGCAPSAGCERVFEGGGMRLVTQVEDEYLVDNWPTDADTYLTSDRSTFIVFYEGTDPLHRAKVIAALEEHIGG